MDKQINEYKNFQIHSYKYSGSYGHHRISKIIRPDGSIMDGLKFNYKMVNGNAVNIGNSHKKCVDFAIAQIEWELAGFPVMNTGHLS